MSVGKRNKSNLSDRFLKHNTFKVDNKQDCNPGCSLSMNKVLMKEMYAHL